MEQSKVSRQAEVDNRQTKNTRHQRQKGAGKKAKSKKWAEGEKLAGGERHAEYKTGRKAGMLRLG